MDKKKGKVADSAADKKAGKGKPKVRVVIEEEEPERPSVMSTHHPYHGSFEADFLEACRRMEVEGVPPIIQRAKPPNWVEPPKPEPESADDGKKGKHSSKKGTKKSAPSGKPAVAAFTPPQCPEEEVARPVTPGLAELEYQTFWAKPKEECLKPALQVETEPAEPFNLVTGLFIRGWKVSLELMKVLDSCCACFEKLQIVDFWRVGLTAESVCLLSCMLPLCPNLKTVILDANPVEEQNYQVLLDGNKLQQLSLRHCGITDTGACRIARALGTARDVNRELLSLDLAGNHLTDEGAGAMAKALRTNRTLLVLSLANNKIGDRGAKLLAESLGPFTLVHEEIVERRRFLSIRDATAKTGKPLAAHYNKEWTNYGRRNAIVGSLTGDGKTDPFTADELHGRKSSRRFSSIIGKKKEELSALLGGDKKSEKGGKEGKEEGKGKKGGKADRDDSGGKKEETKGRGKKDDRDDHGGKAGKDETRKGKGKDDKDSGKDEKGKGKKGRGKAKKAVFEEIMPEDGLESAEQPSTSKGRQSALLDATSDVKGVWRLAGNFALVSLNLSRNQIGEDGLRSWLQVVKHQITHRVDPASNEKGLLRLCLHKNRVPADNLILHEIEEVMKPQDPVVITVTEPEASASTTHH